MGDFFHQLHHRYFECNYGTIEMPWDRLFGTFHDGSGAATRRTRDRKRRMAADKASVSCPPARGTPVRAAGAMEWTPPICGVMMRQNENARWVRLKRERKRPWRS